MATPALDLSIVSLNRTLPGQAAIEYLAFLDEHVSSCDYARQDLHRFCHLCKQWKEATSLLLEQFGV